MSLYPSAAGIHHCIDCRALKTTEKIPADFADLPWRLCSHGTTEVCSCGMGG